MFLLISIHIVYNKRNNRQYVTTADIYLYIPVFQIIMKNYVYAHITSIWNNVLNTKHLEDTCSFSLDQTDLRHFVTYTRQL